MNKIPVWWIEEWAKNFHYNELFNGCFVNDYCDGYVQNVIDCLVASWIRKNDSVSSSHWDHNNGDLVCSECNIRINENDILWAMDDIPKYCPNCGTKMDKTV